MKLNGDKVSALLIIVNGLICLIFAEQVLQWLPTLCGCIILMKGLIRCIQGVRQKEYASLEHKGFEKSLIVMTIGIGILTQQEDALFVVGMFWGLSGLNHATDALNIALHHMCHKGPFLAQLLKGVGGFILSLILIFDPFKNVAHHIIILGLELVLEGSLKLFPKSPTAKIQLRDTEENKIHV